LDDTHWIDQTLEGDAEAFGHLVRKYERRLHGSMARVIGNHSEVDDVIQEAFLRAFRNLSKFQRQCAFYTWLYQIALNLTYPLRRLRRRCASLDQDPWRFSEELGRKSLDPSRRLTEAERYRQVHQALASLDASHREVLVLREFDGREYREIAATLNLPIGTVRSRLHRARVQLLRELRGRLDWDDE
jgi:RNA polymerase sigma-70 factor (ECF subfamily)